MEQHACPSFVRLEEESMKKFRIIITEHYTVEAKSKDDAIEKYENETSYDLIYDNIEVMEESEFLGKQ